MRKTSEKQIQLPETTPTHPKAEELKIISDILDTNPGIYDLALKDITSGDGSSRQGANGMTADQVVRAAILKQMEGFTYRELEFHIADSRSYGQFCKVGFGSRTFRKSVLQKNIKALSAETWEAINKLLLQYGKDEKIEDGRQVRIDCTVAESDIHEPTDSSLLWDSVRVLDRLLNEAKDLTSLDFPYQDHTKRAKRRALGVLNAKNDKVRKKAYCDLLKVTEKVIGYVMGAILMLKEYNSPNKDQYFEAKSILEDLQHYLPLVNQVVCQTKRRVIHDEKVPAEEKIVSIFEPHTDIIKKDRRDVFYGHKICLTGGKSNLILDCLVLEGNPADSTLTDTMFDRQKELYGRYPIKAALDGGFASKQNLESAKEKGIKDVCFSKGRGLTEEEMCRSHWIFKKLRNFRAGIESGISWLKRCFGLDRCRWKGLPSFKSYVWSAIVAANLLTLARKQLA